MVLGGQKHAEALMEKQWGHGQLNKLRLARAFTSRRADIAVIFTGSGRVGKLIAAAAAKTLSPTTLEVSHTPTAQLLEWGRLRELTSSSEARAPSSLPPMPTCPQSSSACYPSSKWVRDRCASAQITFCAWRSA